MVVELLAVLDHVREAAVAAKLDVEVREVLRYLQHKQASKTQASKQAETQHAPIIPTANDAGGDVDEAQVDRLLTERVAAKRSREYDKADKLRDELRAMGIEVADKERTWRVRGSGGRGRGRGGDDRGTNGGGPDRGRKRERETDERGGSFANDGSFLDQFETESRHEDSVRQKKGGSSRDDEHDGRDDVGSKSGTTQFKKPSAALDPSKMLGMLQSLAGGASEEGGSGDQPAPAADTPSAGTTDAASEYSSEEDANKLAAEALRAKLMGDINTKDMNLTESEAQAEILKSSLYGGLMRQMF